MHGSSSGGLGFCIVTLASYTACMTRIPFLSYGFEGPEPTVDG